MEKGKIGLEIHVYLITKEKLFCHCASKREKGLTPNTHICPICTGQPGAKPLLPNKKALEKAVQVALMLQCTVNKKLVWQRKHYSWPDLPKGYQNTLSGARAFPVGIKGNFQGIGIWSMHLEEDPASWDPLTGAIDYNRSGLPLLEIITAPEFTTADEVMEWLKELLHNLEYLNAVASDAGIKVDVNVNIPGLSERVEIKNVNSIETIGLAIDYELARHRQEGSQRETRRFDTQKNKTMKMREKEGDADYRFISDPDLQEIIIDEKWVDAIRATLPETPQEKIKKYQKEYKLEEKEALVLAQNIDIAHFFEGVAKKIEPKFAARWTTVELLRHLNYNKKKLTELDIKEAHFIELLTLVQKGTITELQAKDLLNKFNPASFSPSTKIEKKIEDAGELTAVCKEVLKENPSVVEKYHAGDGKVLNFLLGAVMQKTHKRADFKVAKEVLEKLLSK